uniref:Uncharacterized protein n=1 Tax=Anguilla anguilla TaxID=7936 RepID=A0A0E9S6E5_ANGAN
MLTHCLYRHLGCQDKFFLIPARM